MSENLHRLKVRTGTNTALVNKENDVGKQQPIYNSDRRYLSIGDINPTETTKKYKNIKPITVRLMQGNFAENEVLMTNSDLNAELEYYVGPKENKNNGYELIVENSGNVPVKLKNKNGAVSLTSDGNFALTSSKYLFTDKLKSTSSDGRITVDSGVDFSEDAKFVKSVVMESTLQVKGKTTVEDLDANKSVNITEDLTVGKSTTLTGTTTAKEKATFEKGVSVSGGITTDSMDSTGNISITKDNKAMFKATDEGNVNIGKDAVVENKTTTKSLVVNEKSTFKGDLDASNQTLIVSKIILGDK